MGELSSNWKRLQDKIKAESTAQKRKPSDEDTSSEPRKRQKQPGAYFPTRKPSSKPKSSKTTSTRTASRNSGSAQTASSKSASKIPSTSKDNQMGATTSSQLCPPASKTITPSLHLWASANDITSESLSEAYSLGLSASTLTTHPTRPNVGLDASFVPGKYLAIDCEMVGIGPGGHASALARVSLVDFHGRQIYDSFVRPRERVTDWRTHVSGVSAREMGSARGFDEVQAVVADLLQDRILVGHDVKHDLEALELSHSSKMIRDTAKFSEFRKYGHGPKPALRVLAQELLGVEIQRGQHSSVEDARVAMLLFRRHKSAFDVEHTNRFPDTVAKEKGEKKQKKRRN